jgi:hypothetical protein
VHAEKFSPTLESALSYIEVAFRVQQTLRLKSDSLDLRVGAAVEQTPERVA